MRATALLLAGLALAAPALGAADPPAATATAQRGPLKFVSRALLDARGGELKATWLDASRSCAAQRTLRVSYEIDLVTAAGRTTRSAWRARTAAGGPGATRSA